jgi:hypothetical protein
LVSIDMAANKFSMFVVFHDADLVPPRNSALMRIPSDEIRSHIEAFVSTCLYHMWTSLIV